MSAARSRIAVVVLAAALPLAGCGSSDKGLLTAREANRLASPLKRAQAAVVAGRCGVARQEAQLAADRTANLSSRVDAKLQRNLADGFNHLVDTINSECAKQEESTPTPTVTTTVTETPTPTVTETETPTPTKTATPTPSPSPTVTVSPTTTVTATPTPDT